MGLFEIKTSRAGWVRGRLIYTPIPPEPRWKAIASGGVPLLFVIAYLSRYGASLGNLLAGFAVCSMAVGLTWFLRRRAPVRPAGPLEVGHALIARVRRLLETGRVGDAMLAVEAELSVTLTDAKVIVDAVQRRIDHDRAEAREGR